MNAPLDIAAIRAAQPLSAIVGQSLALKRAGREYVACCPFHDERTPSFTVNDDKAFAHCFGCGWHGDVLDFVQAVAGVGLREAAERITGGDFPRLEQTSPRGEVPDRDTVGEALAIWRGASPAEGTPAETYFREVRGLSLPIPPTVRFARLRYGKHGPEHACLVALLTSCERKPVGIQRTFLRPDGLGKLAVDKPKLSLGNVRGAAIRLSPEAAELVVCEGLEDGLTLQQETGRSAWVAAGAAMLPALRLPTGVESVVIGADADEAGERSAREAATAFSLEGRSVRIMRPAAGFKDFNAQLTGGRN